MKILSLVILLLIFSLAQSRAQSQESKPYSYVVKLKQKDGSVALFPRKPDQDTSLLAGIVDAIRKGQIITYTDSGFREVIPVAQINKIIRQTCVTDTIIYPNTPKNEEVDKIVEMIFDFYGITDFRILAKGRFEVQIIGIGVDRHKAAADYSKEYGYPAHYRQQKRSFG